VKRSLVRNEVLPFLTMFTSLILATILADFLLHIVGLVWVGRWLGVPGAIFILLSFFYSMRKHKIIKIGRPRTLLTLHQSSTWIGSLLILVHAGVHVYTVLPWLALTAMLVTVVSGMTGTILLNRSRQFIERMKEGYSQDGLSDDEIAIRIFWDATTYELMKKWRSVHIPINIIFGVLSVSHILSILLFWNWK
jgi:hypothetical protein